MDFEDIPHKDISWGIKLGSGSFGCVYKGEYLGLDIAIKEVLPSKDYDVNKYFMREHLLMRECRHPNIVLFLGLSKEGGHDWGKTYIISEYIPNGNLRQYIQDVSRPFPWRLRVSFMIDIARAVAYLHARKCIHRDLKGENLLITSNDRVKVTDFGFARIAARNDDEMRRMSYCGTDGYMSPEILMGMEFDERTDVFSLGIIFAEIASRRLVESEKYFTRYPPTFTLDPKEVQELVSPGCPPDLIKLIEDCTQFEPKDRPSMPDVLERLRKMEIEILSRLTIGAGEHVGSIKIVKGKGKGKGKGLEIKTRDLASLFRGKPFDPLGKTGEEGEEKEDFEYDTDEEEVLKMMEGAGSVNGTEVTTYRTARWEEPKESVMSLFANPPSKASIQPRLPGGYPSGIIREEPTTSSSIMTVKATHQPLVTAASESVIHVPEQSASVIAPEPAQTRSEIPTNLEDGPVITAKVETNVESKADAAEQVETDVGKEPGKDGEASKLPATHRFTVIGKSFKPPVIKKQSVISSAFAIFQGNNTATNPNKDVKCHACKIKIGRRPAMECDDCHVFVHVKCSDKAPIDCNGH